MEPGLLQYNSVVEKIITTDKQEVPSTTEPKKTEERTATVCHTGKKYVHELVPVKNHMTLNASAFS